MKGGHPNSGPPPDPNALRRDRPSDAAEWTHLPATGRQGPAPEWPLIRPSRRELVLWEQEWSRPQAVMWEINDQAKQVAQYVRYLAEAEKPRAATPLRTLVKQLEEVLGISLAGLSRNRWIIASTTGPAQRPRVVAGTSTKERLNRGA